MSIMFSSPAYISMLLMGIILFVSVVGAIGWAIYHVARGKFHEEYEIVTAHTKKDINGRKSED